MARSTVPVPLPAPPMVATESPFLTRATFDAGKATYTPGPCMLAAKDARDKQFAGVVESVDGGKVTVRIVTGAPVKAGDQVVLLPPK